MLNGIAYFCYGIISKNFSVVEEGVRANGLLTTSESEEQFPLIKVPRENL